MFTQVGSSTTLVLPISMRYPGVGMTGHSQSDLNDAARDMIASCIFPIGGLDFDAADAGTSKSQKTMVKEDEVQKKEKRS